jgi:hypothetical protein
LGPQPREARQNKRQEEWEGVQRGVEGKVITDEFKGGKVMKEGSKMTWVDPKMLELDVLPEALGHCVTVAPKWTWPLIVPHGQVTISPRALGINATLAAVPGQRSVIVIRGMRASLVNAETI